MNVRGEKINHPALWYLVLDIDLFEYLVEKNSEFHLLQSVRRVMYKSANFNFYLSTSEQRNKCFLIIVFLINQAWHLTCIRHVQNNNPLQRQISTRLRIHVTRDFYPWAWHVSPIERGEARCTHLSGHRVIGTALVTSLPECKYVQREKSLMKVSRERKIILKFQLEW